MVPRVWEAVEGYWEFTTERGGFSGEGSMRALPNTEGNRPAGHEATSLDFAVNFSTAGTDYFWVRGGCNGGADNSCHVGIDDTVPATAQNLTQGYDRSFTGWFFRELTFATFQGFACVSPVNASRQGSEARFWSCDAGGRSVV
jgi:hypothetical protein